MLGFTTWTHENGTENERAIFVKIWKSSQNCIESGNCRFFEED
ncbi:hypothetical protein LEP1GSC133_2503 [Leptospira borgpetersenii serovar Pomona str. 200901868]|uniref:Uncharacterized protein n=1 Tax=Leptospira borgpetersenii serovar Pomona str. 200901868 TaxID=1192866 RepID=M6VZ27_LEPBO|nr:hypothetical protein LEP1GSC133_2503 [Leptospira borgpetersenii serovar Pomona str. 200901868]